MALEVETRTADNGITVVAPTGRLDVAGAPARRRRAALALRDRTWRDRQQRPHAWPAGRDSDADRLRAATRRGNRCRLAQRFRLAGARAPFTRDAGPRQRGGAGPGDGTLAS